MLNKQNEGFLKKEDVIKYGSDKDKQHNYICPRYWCLKTNSVILPSELEEKTDAEGNKYLEHPTCGKILTYNSAGLEQACAYVQGQRRWRRRDGPCKGQATAGT